MYWCKRQDIDIPFIHDAVLLCEMKGLKLRDVYMDNHGELAIAFFGKLSKDDIKFVIMQFCKDDKEIAEPEEHQDFVYRKDFTEIYTPDGVDYRN